MCLEVSLLQTNSLQLIEYFSVAINYDIVQMSKNANALHPIFLELL